MSFPRLHRSSALVALLAATLVGCASKNPLMDDAPVQVAHAKPAETPAAHAADAAPVAGNATETAATREEQTPAAATGPAPSGAPATITSGVTTTGPTGIQKFLGFLSPYKIDIQQGNFVSREMVEQLRESMQRPEGITREQVRFALGTPLLTDIFHADRWDYNFRLKRRDGTTISSRVIVFFKDNRLVRIESGELPTEQEYLAFIAGSAPGTASDK